MSDAPISRERWLEHLGRVLAVSEERKGRLEAGELAAIAGELGITHADLAVAEKEAEDHLTRGAGFAARALWDDAITELTEARALAPMRLDIALALARAHQRRGRADDRESADRIARVALEWEPNNAAAFAVLADLDARRRGLRVGVVVGVVGAVVALALIGFVAARPGQVAGPEGPAPASGRAGPAVAAAPMPPPSPLASAVQPDPDCPQHSVWIRGQGCVAQDIEVVPGVGIGDLRLGRSTPEDVLAALGDDAKINRYSTGETYEINYDYVDDDAYEPSRRRNWARPESFAFERGVLVKVVVGVYNRQLRTPGGLNTQRSTLDDAMREFGDHYELTPGEMLDQYRWSRRGIEVWINRDRQTVNSFRLLPIEP